MVFLEYRAEGSLETQYMFIEGTVGKSLGPVTSQTVIQTYVIKERLFPLPFVSQSDIGIQGIKRTVPYAVSHMSVLLCKTVIPCSKGEYTLFPVMPCIKAGSRHKIISLPGTFLRAFRQSVKPCDTVRTIDF